MAKAKKGRQNWAVSIVILIVILLVSVLPNLNISSIPSWNEMYNKAGLNSGVITEDFPVSVHYIDVGQGDCILIKSEEGNILIDAGEKEYKTKIIAYLNSQDVKTLDYLIATHPHSDHIGGMSGIIENVDVKNVILPQLSQINMPTTRTYENLLLAIKDSDANAIPATTGSEYKIGEMTFKILSPSNQSENLNNMSVVVKLTYKKHSFLFMGDAEKEIENEILQRNENVSSNVIKLGHHGSNTSTTESFLKKAKTQLAIIYFGKNNSYGPTQS